MTATSARGRTALCLCGGGITGGMYEIGALAAIDDFFVRQTEDGVRSFSVNDFDIYVGTSAGAFVATVAAAGLRARRMVSGVLDGDASILPAQRSDIYRFDVRQGVGFVRDIARVLVSAGARTLRRRGPRPGELLGELAEVLPAGIFSLRHYERFLDGFLRLHSLPTTFHEVPHELYITANDLDSGHRAVFGLGELRDAPLAVAICASSAIPLFFEPVRWREHDYVDGAVGKVAHADLAISRGADVVVIVNPLVPYRHEPGRGLLPTALRGARHMRDKGMFAVYSQAGRMSTHTKLQQGLRRYQAAYPHASLLLIEPPEEEGDMFLHNPMSWETRALMVRYGYESTARLLRRYEVEWRRAFGPHGIDVDTAQLDFARGAPG